MWAASEDLRLKPKWQALHIHMSPRSKAPQREAVPSNSDGTLSGEVYTGFTSSCWPEEVIDALMNYPVYHATEKPKFS
ncbi:unnamed protein product, partial [Ceratitis capitata]